MGPNSHLRICFWVLGIVVVAGAVTALPIHVARDHFHCLSCGSTRTVSEWRWGQYWPEKSRSLSEAWEDIYPSTFHKDWLDAAHVHEWQPCERSGTYSLGLRWSSRMSSGVWSPRWLEFYENNPDFRRWLRDQIDDGRILKAALITAATAVGRCPPHIHGGMPDPSRPQDNTGDQWMAHFKVPGAH